MADDDVTRRTRLAGERTYLAWWGTGLGAAFALLGIGFAPLSERLLSGLAAAGVVLGIALLLVIVTVT